MKNPIIFFAFFLSLASASYGQGDTLYIGSQYSGLTWKGLAEELEQRAGVKLYYEGDTLARMALHISGDSIPLIRALSHNLPEKDYKVYADGRGNYFCLKNLRLKTSLSNNFFQRPRATRVVDTGERSTGKSHLKTYSDYVTEKVTIGSRKEGRTMQRAEVRGFVSNASDGQPIPQATLKIEEQNLYTTTDVSGHYSLKLDKGEYTLSVNSIGSHEKKYRIQVLSDGRLNIDLKTKTYKIEETVVTADRHDNVRATKMGMEKLNTKNIKKMPVVMGEQDIIKVALMLPGVQSVSEASSGFNVRGSPSDQNMFYLNNLPLYNVHHLFGMFTAFNSDAVDEFSLYKSSMPVDHGGRLSSIFDIEAQQGNMKKFSARGGISPVTSRLMVEGPIKQDTASYMASFRTTYSDWLLNEIKNPTISNSQARFSDAMINLTHRLGSHNHLNLLAYGSRDYADIPIGFENQYSNAGASLQWKHHFSEDHRFRLSLAHSNYHFREINEEIEYLSSRQSFDLNHSEVKLNFDYDITELHNLQYGVNLVHYQLHQGDFMPLKTSSRLQPVSFEPEKGLKASVFVGDKWEITPDLTVDAGLRATQYTYLGAKSIYTYPDREPREVENITDTLHYGQLEPITNYRGLDYRLSAKYMIEDDFSVKAGYNRLHQYIFLMSNTLSATPTDIWKLSDPHIQPMAGSQYSMGLYKNLSQLDLEASLEGYYKTVDNLVEIKDGANLLYSKRPETDIIQGDLHAYGLEFMLRLNSDPLNGWVNYTYSRSMVKAVNKKRGTSNNLGFSYPANYDKPHTLNMTLNYQLTKRWSVSTNVKYASGQPVTYPKSLYYQNGIQVTGFSRRNESRLPEYFRVDLSINYEGNLKKDKFAHGSWSLSFYNLTGRRNPYSVHFRNEGGNIQGYRLSIFGTVIPSLTYNLKLGHYED